MQNCTHKKKIHETPIPRKVNRGIARDHCIILQLNVISPQLLVALFSCLETVVRVGEEEEECHRGAVSGATCKQSLLAAPLAAS